MKKKKKKWSVDRNRYGHFLTSAHPALGEPCKHRRLKGEQGGSSLPRRAEGSSCGRWRGGWPGSRGRGQRVAVAAEVRWPHRHCARQGEPALWCQPRKQMPSRCLLEMLPPLLLSAFISKPADFLPFLIELKMFRFSRLPPPRPSARRL